MAERSLSAAVAWVAQELDDRGYGYAGVIVSESEEHRRTPRPT